MIRRCLLQILIIFASPVMALNHPHTPEQLREVSDITSLIGRERSDFKTYLEKHRDDVDKATRKIDNEAAIAALTEELDARIAAHKAVMTEVIKRTVKLYDIQPRPADYLEDRGKIVVGVFSGQHPAWAPIYAPEVTAKQFELNGKKIVLTAPGAHEAITWDDGTVELNDKAFAYSAGYLGAVIFHESVHFAQITTKGRGDKISTVRSEMEAHSASSSPEAAEAFALTPREKAAIENAFTRQMEIFSRDGSAGMGTAQFASPGSDSDGGAAFWASAQGGAALERAARADNAAIAAMQEASRVALNRNDQERSHRELASRKEADQSAYKFLLSVIGLACSNPGQYRYQIEHAGRSVDLEINTDVLSALFNQDAYHNGSKSVGRGPNSCQETILRRIISTNGPMTTTDFLRWAMEYREAHPSLLHQFTSSVGDFIEALRTVPSSEGGGSTGGSSDGGSPRSVNESTNNHTRDHSEVERRVHVIMCGTCG